MLFRILFNQFFSLQLHLFNVQLQLLFNSYVLSHICFKLNKHFFISCCLFVQLLLQKGSLPFCCFVCVLALILFLNFLEWCEGRLVRKKFIFDLLKKLGLWLFLFKIDAVPDLFFQAVFFQLNIHLPELLLVIPIILKLFKFINSHMHQNFNRWLYIVNDIKSIDTIQINFFLFHCLITHLLDFFLRSYFHIQV